MDKMPAELTLEAIRDHVLGPDWPATSNDGRQYVPARPIGFWSWRERFRLAWLVFTGRADALVWPQGQ